MTPAPPPAVHPAVPPYHTSASVWAARDRASRRGKQLPPSRAPPAAIVVGQSAARSTNPRYRAVSRSHLAVRSVRPVLRLAPRLRETIVCVLRLTLPRPSWRWRRVSAVAKLPHAMERAAHGCVTTQCAHPRVGSAWRIARVALFVMKSVHTYGPAALATPTSAAFESACMALAFSIPCCLWKSGANRPFVDKYIIEGSQTPQESDGSASVTLCIADCHLLPCAPIIAAAKCSLLRALCWPVLIAPPQPCVFVAHTYYLVDSTIGGTLRFPLVFSFAAVCALCVVPVLRPCVRNVFIHGFVLRVPQCIALFGVCNKNARTQHSKGHLATTTASTLHTLRIRELTRAPLVH